jgi:DNA-binding IclR family transcriptional regulator
VSDRVQSIERGIDVLMALVQGPKTLTEVTRETGLSKGTAFRMLASLNYENMVVKSDGNAYMLGPGCLRLIQGVLEGLGAIIGVGRPALIALWEQTGETVAVHVRVGGERICIEELPSPSPVRFVSTVGSSAPLHVGSAGRVLLAFASPSERERTIDALIASDTGVDPDKLRRELEKIRELGYALSVGERVHGAAAISVPVFGRQGFVASLSVLGPDFRLTEQHRLDFLPALRKTAEAIGTALVEAGSNGAERGQ